MSPSIPQEDDRVGARAVTRVVVVGLLVGAVAVGASAMLLGATRASTPRRVNPHGARTEPREIEQVDQTLIERDDYGPRMRERQRRELERYGWVDRARGVARIPIGRAMDLVVRGGGR